jgi:ferredoxin-NADP reductase
MPPLAAIALKQWHVMSEVAYLDLIVVAVERLTPSIRRFKLACSQGHPLPGFEPGAHISVKFSDTHGVNQSRAYSLIHTDTQSSTLTEQPFYEIAVRLDLAGKGGSRHLHEQLQVDSPIASREPSNHFVFEARAGAVLIAGGIGVTPLVSMACDLVRRGVDFSMHYAARNPCELAYAQELKRICGDKLHIHLDSDASKINIQKVLASYRPDQALHICGPAGMIAAVSDTAQSMGWPDKHIHFEAFTNEQSSEGTGYEVELKRSGKVITVAQDQTLLDALLDANVDVMYDCRAGYCGLCSVPVASGDIDHRDTFLTKEDKLTGKVMQACVSRGCSSRLVLSL